MRNFWIIILLLAAIVGLHAQEPEQQTKTAEKEGNYIQHKTVAGETLYSIGKKYNIPIQEISECNPRIIPVLKTGVILKIPSHGREGAAADSVKFAPSHFISHTVRKKETLYKISREYGIPVDAIKEYNPGLTTLKRGETIQIPQWKSRTAGGITAGKPEATVPATKIAHWVQSGETLYSISQRYGQSVASILEMNPAAKELKTGMRLTIMKGRTIPADHQTVPSDFVYHTIVPGETLFSVSRKYNVPAEKMVELNPSLDSAFQAGSVIRIPGAQKRKEAPARENKVEGLKHVVKKGETLYGLSQSYKVPMSEILKYNPFLGNRPPRTGDTVLIVTSGAKPGVKEKTEVPSEITDGTKGIQDNMPQRCTPGDSYSDDKTKVKIALLVPVFLESNRILSEAYKPDNDNAEPGDTSPDEANDLKMADTGPGITFQRSSESFIHFYEGALLAIDTLQQMGIRIELNVFDTEQKASKVKNLVSSGKLDQMDLIIGPVYPGEQKELSDFAAKNHIPVISPLSSSDEVTKDNPWFYQVNPTREFIWQRTNEYLISEYRNCNILVLQTSSSESVAEDETARLKEELERSEVRNDKPEIRICDFRKDGYSGLRNAMIKERRNVIVIPSKNEAEVSVVVSNIQALANDFEVTLIGTNRFPQFESINPEQYHYGQLEFLTPYWPDYNQKVARSFVYNFRDYFKTEPNQFSIQGYDVTFFFVKAVVDYGSDLPECIRNASSELVQGTYHFIKSATGGYINDGLNVIRYTPDFRIVRKMTFSGRNSRGINQRAEGSL